MSNGEATKETVQVNFIKTPSCVEIPINGAFGGINTLTGQVWLAVYAERSPLPQEAFYTVALDGSTQELTEQRVGRSGAIRIVQNIMHFDINTAIALRNWLSDRIDAFAQAHPELAEQLASKK